MSIIENGYINWNILAIEILENNLSILSPLRFLGIKKKDLKLYRKMQGLVSHREERVSYPKSKIRYFNLSNACFFQVNGDNKESIEISTQKIRELLSEDLGEIWISALHLQTYLRSTDRLLAHFLEESSINKTNICLDKKGGHTCMKSSPKK